MTCLMNFVIASLNEVRSYISRILKKKRLKWVANKHLTHFCYPISLVFYLHLNSHVAYSDIPPENSKRTQGQYKHLPSYPHLRFLWSKSDKTSAPERVFLTSITLELYLAQLHWTLKPGLHEPQLPVERSVMSVSCIVVKRYCFVLPVSSVTRLQKSKET